MTTSSPPTWLSVDPSRIPHQLTDTDAWVVWRSEIVPNRPGKWTKIPYRAADPTAKASSTDSKTWSSFDDAYMRYQSDPSIHGIGYVLHDEGITGVDLDDAFTEDDTLKPWAQEIVAALEGAYWERSPSGKGIRGLCRAHLPPGRRKRVHDGSSIEIYDDVRFLTITGAGFEDATPTELVDLQEAVEAIHSRWFDGEATAPGAVLTTGQGATDDPGPIGMQVLEAACSDERRAARFLQWWSSDYSAWHDDQSAGDWFGGNEAAYHLIRLGLDGPTAAGDLEQTAQGRPLAPEVGFTAAGQGRRRHTDQDDRPRAADRPAP